MARVNFGKVVIKTITGEDAEVDFRKDVRNQLYMQGKDIEECELGKRIYYAEGRVELSDKECDVVRNAVQGYPYLIANIHLSNAPSKVK